VTAPRSSRPGTLSERLTRLEKERGHAPEEHVGLGNASRFGGGAPEPEAPVDVPPLAPGSRFEPAVESLEVEAVRTDEQPFVRCAACGTEGGKFTRSCITCGAEFDAPEQRLYNEQVWAARRAEQAQEQQASQERQAALDADAAQHQAQRQRLNEALAREAGETARLRLDAEALLPGDGWSDRSPLLSLLGRLPGEWRWFLGGALLTVPVSMVALGAPGGRVRAVGAAAVGLLGLLIMPPSWWLRGSRWR
jgi:hypothetical protein